MADPEGNRKEEMEVVEYKKTRRLRVSGKDHAKMIIVGAGARVLFYPTLLYNVVRNRLQSEFRWWDEIDQFLVLGAVPFPGDIPRLKSVGVHAVVTLNESYETLVPTSLYKNQGINHLVIPTRDYMFAPSQVDIARAVEFIHEHAIRGKRTYVHCKAGRGRSTTVVICYLVKHRGMSPMEAWQHVQAKRPRVLLASAQWKAVQYYSEQCRLRPFTNFPATHFEIEDEDGSDLPVVVTKSDLAGYRSIEDAGLVGNELWKDIGLLCRLRLLAFRSSAWSKVSGLLAGSSHHSGGRNLPVLQSETGGSCKKLASSGFTPVPVCQSGLVN